MQIDPLEFAPETMRRVYFALDNSGATCNLVTLAGRTGYSIGTTLERLVDLRNEGLAECSGRFGWRRKNGETT